MKKSAKSKKAILAAPDPHAEAASMRQALAESDRHAERLESEFEAAVRLVSMAPPGPEKQAEREHAKRIQSQIADLVIDRAGLEIRLRDAEAAILRENEARAAVDAKDHEAQVQSAVDAALSAIDRAHGLFAAGATATDAAIGAIEYCWHFDRFHAGVLSDRLMERLSVGHLKATYQAQTDFVVELPAASVNPVNRDTSAVDGTFDKVVKEARQTGDVAVEVAGTAGVELALAIGEARTRIRAVSEIEPGFDVGPLTAKLSASLKRNVLQAAGFKRRLPSTMPGLAVEFVLCSAHPAVPKGQADSELEAAQRAYSEAHKGHVLALLKVKQTQDRLKQFPKAAVAKRLHQNSA